MELATSQIIPYQLNNRTHPEEQIDRIARSIKNFGFNQPIVIDENRVVLVGHGRLLAAQKLGLEKCPIVQKFGLSETDKRAYRILDNKLQNDSTWEFTNLEVELEALELEGFDLGDWGLDQLKNLLPDQDPEVVEDNFEPKEQLNIFIKTGNLIELGRHRVLCGDSTIDYDFPICDMCLTDPPYGVAYKGKTKDELTIESDDVDEESLSQMWHFALSQILNHLKDGGSIYATVPPGPLREVFSSRLKSLGALRQELVWKKDSMVLGHSDYHFAHEPILYGWKPGAAHYFTENRSKTSVLEHARPKRSLEHPTMKPLSLWGELISNSSKPGQKILDPFLGSGTTLIAAEQLNRICYGIEISPQYCQVVMQRYAKHCLDNKKECIMKVNGEPFDKAYLEV